MRTHWKELKPIISSVGWHNKQYLSVLDEQGNILLANARMQKELNLKNPRQVKSNFFNLLHPVHIEKLRNAFRYSVKNNIPYSIGLEIKNGHSHSMVWRVNYLQQEVKGINTFICLGSLKTERPALEKESVADNKLLEIIFQSFMKNSPHLAWVTDEEANLVFANDSFYQYFRIDEKTLNKKIADLVPLNIVDLLYEKHQKVLQTGLPIEIIEKGWTQGGVSAIFKIKIFFIEGKNGRKMAGGVAFNYSEIYESEKKLSKANERLKHITSITSDAIWEWDMLSDQIFRNEKLTTMIGFQVEDTKELSWWLSRVHPEDRDQLNKKLKEVTDKSLHSWKSEYRFLCADGEYKNMLDRGFVIYENGMPVKMIGSLSDITGEKLLTNLLVEEKLQQYKKISEAVLQVQELERTRIGHELHDNVNQILSTSKMFVDIIKTTTSEDAHLKGKITEYLLMAIEEIRKLSKEMVTPQLKENGLITSIGTLVDDLKATNVVNILFCHHDDIEMLSIGKKVALFRIVQEQIKNTLKYSKAKNLTITLQLKNENAQLIIEDDGVGFDTKQNRRGIGLSNIYERTRFYNGTVQIKTAPGQGCKMIIRIPMIN